MSLERIYMKAKQTGRASTFSTPDLIHKVLRRKLEYLIKKWSIERVKMEKRADSIGTDCHVDMDVSHFLNFLRRQLKISATNFHVVRSSLEPEPASNESKNPNTAPSTRRFWGDTRCQLYIGQPGAETSSPAPQGRRHQRRQF